MVGKKSDCAQYATLLGRLGLGLMLLAFGIMKVRMPEMQDMLAGLVEQTWAVPVGGGATFVTVLYIVEILLGVALILGFYTKIAGGIAALMFLGTLFVLNPVLPEGMMGPWGPFIIKDIGLLGAALSLMCSGDTSPYSLDTMMKG